jgi:hypothetical protein
MRGSGALRQEISVRNQQIAAVSGSLHALTIGEVPSVIFGCGEDHRHGNFHSVSYRNICANPDWARRLLKVHTASRQAQPGSWRWKELDCANSSDALLMNIFCYRLAVTNRALAMVLGVDAGEKPIFGFRPCLPLRDGKTDRTEIDMKIGDLLVEAKLTEADFQSASLKMVTRYRNFAELFDAAALKKSGDVVRCYQLVRGVLAAHATGGSFCVLCDARRPDLIESWYSVMLSVRSCVLRCRLQLLTWQELAATLPKPLRNFIAEKYGIQS